MSCTCDNSTPQSSERKQSERNKKNDNRFPDLCLFCWDRVRRDPHCTALGWQTLGQLFAWLSSYTRSKFPPIYIPPLHIIQSIFIWIRNISASLALPLCTAGFYQMQLFSYSWKQATKPMTKAIWRQKICHQCCKILFVGQKRTIHTF